MVGRDCVCGFTSDNSCFRISCQWKLWTTVTVKVCVATTMAVYFLPYILLHGIWLSSTTKDSHGYPPVQVRVVTHHLASVLLDAVQHTDDTKYTVMSTYPITHL